MAGLDPRRHCEERSDDPSTLAARASPGWESAEAPCAKAEAIHVSACGGMDCFASLAMTTWVKPEHDGQNLPQHRERARDHRHRLVVGGGGERDAAKAHGTAEPHHARVG